MSVEDPLNLLDVTVRDFAAGEKVFRRYTLTRTLGRGGMGVVWLARDDELERDVALKFLPQLIAHDRAVLGDLKRETRRSLELTHKNIVRIYDFVHDGDLACISMEFIDGDTVSNLRADRPLKIFEPHELIDWMIHLCEALDYAHTHARIVHRDLKPSNLMITKRGDLKVADFGIARGLGDSMSMLTVGRPTTSGTLLYMSPQQLDGEPGSPLDDIYSLGSTIYELLTSKPPFFSGNIDRQIREKIPRPMRDRRIELEIEGRPIDERWEKVVTACLQKEPSKRPQSVIEIPERLGLLSTPSRKTDRRIAVRPPRVPKRRIRRALLAMTGAVSGASKAVFHGAALTIIAPSRAISRAAIAGANAVREDFRDAANEFKGASKAIVHGVGVGIGAVAKTFHSAGLGVIGATKAITRGTEVVVLAGVKELSRAVAITIIPAALVAAGIWYFAIRPPPPKQIVQQAPPKTQSSEPPKAQPAPPANESHIANAPPLSAASVAPSVAPSVIQPESHVALVQPMPKPTAPNLPPPKPPPPIEGSVSLETTPAGATVTVDGSTINANRKDVFVVNGKAHERKTLPNLAVGKHHVQVAMDGYVTQEMDTDINAGQVASLGVITLHPTAPPREEATAKPEAETVKSVAEKANEQKVATAKKPARNRQAAVTRAEKSPAPASRRAVAQPVAKTVSKPAATPKPSGERKRQQNPFGEGAPGG